MVNAEGTRAGDDIVIFERSRFPTLALRDRADYARKEFIPIEAAYAYIEVKHTLHLEDEGSQGLSNATKQVSKVKQLCSAREEITAADVFGPYTNAPWISDTVSPPRGMPSIKNPMYGMILARNVSRAEGKPNLTDPTEVKEAIEEILPTIATEPGYEPDLLLLSENAVVVPVLPSEREGIEWDTRPFLVQGQTEHFPQGVEGVAVGIGLSQLMYALEWIQLGVLPWGKIVIDAINKSQPNTPDIPD